MAPQYLTLYFIIVLFINWTQAFSIHHNFMPEVQEKDFDMQSHLKYQNVWEYCSHRDDACRSNNTNICAMKMLNGKKFYKDFANGCYLFLLNMCDHPEDEYFIVTSGTCEEYLALRRSQDEETILPKNEETFKTATETSNTDNSALRQSMSTLYEIDSSYDYHVCPLSCPDIYEPICVNVNRGHGKYFKMLTFVNHCASDVYYCKHWREFEPPPGENENIKPSPLGWSFCGSSRYLQFARFSEVTSSMSHYGWLAGDYKYTHIMEPHQRIPGYG